MKAKATIDRNPNRKEIFALWWEYLKRSNNYKEFCDLMKSLRGDSKDDFEVYERVEKRWMAKTSSKSEKEKKYHDCYRLYLNWEEIGNVFEASFDDWWPKIRSKNKLLFGEDRVIEFSEQDAQNLMIRIADRYSKLKQEKKKEDDVSLFFDVMASDPAYMYVAIPIFSDLTSKEIAEQISLIRKLLRKDKNVQKYDERFKLHREPMGRIRLEELKRYLKIYDMKLQGLSMRKIIKRYDPEMDDKDVYIQRRFYSDIENAKKIIANVEQGIFPGSYYAKTDK